MIMLKSFLDSGDIVAQLWRRSAAARGGQLSSGEPTDNPGEGNETVRRGGRSRSKAAKLSNFQFLDQNRGPRVRFSPRAVRTFPGSDPSRERPDTRRGANNVAAPG